MIPVFSVQQTIFTALIITLQLLNPAQKRVIWEIHLHKQEQLSDFQALSISRSHPYPTSKLGISSGQQTAHCNEVNDSWPWSKAQTTLRTVKGGCYKRLPEKMCECTAVNVNLRRNISVAAEQCSEGIYLQDISVRFPAESEDVTHHLMGFSARILAGFVSLISRCSLLRGTCLPFVHLDTHTSHCWVSKYSGVSWPSSYRFVKLSPSVITWQKLVQDFGPALHSSWPQVLLTHRNLPGRVVYKTGPGA